MELINCKSRLALAIGISFTAARRYYIAIGLFMFTLVFDSRYVTTKEYWCPKRTSSIHYDYRKWGTHARLFSQTLSHGNSKLNKTIKQKNKVRRGE